MALIKCVGCGHEVSDHADMCPHCGYPIHSVDKTSKYALSYHHERRFECSSYSIAIPDCFILKKDPGDKKFIAYLPSSEELESDSADIIFFCGEFHADVLNPDLCTEEICIELAKKLASSTEIIKWEPYFLPIKGTVPAGGIVGYFDENRNIYHYNAILLIDGSSQTMKIMVRNADISEKNAVDQMVLRWLHSMEVHTSPAEYKTLGDMSLTSVSLDESLRDEWCTLFQLYKDRLGKYYQLKIDNRTSDYKKNSPKGRDNREKLLNDLSLYLNEMSGRINVLAKEACDAICMMEDYNSESKLLLEICNYIEPFYKDNEELSLEVDDRMLRIKVENIAQYEQRIKKLKEQLVLKSISPENRRKEKKKKKRTYIIIAAVICVLLAITSIMLFANPSKNDSMSKNDPVQNLGNGYRSISLNEMILYSPIDWEYALDLSESGVLISVEIYDCLTSDDTYHYALSVWADDEFGLFGGAEAAFEACLNDEYEPMSEFDKPGCSRAAVSEIIYDDDPDMATTKDYCFLCDNTMYYLTEIVNDDHPEEGIDCLDKLVDKIEF